MAEKKEKKEILDQSHHDSYTITPRFPKQSHSEDNHTSKKAQ